MPSSVQIHLEDKTAIVSGAARGIGAAISRLFVQLGASVALVDLDQNALARTVSGLTGESGGRALAFPADVRSPGEVENAVNEAVKELGPVHILVCNAGINRDAVIWKMTEDQWDQVIDTNLKGYFNLMRVMAPRFRGQKYGRIVSITSINGLRGKFGQANYAASKAGIIGLTKTVARELGPSQVTVNAIAPGMIVTEMARELEEKWLDAARSEAVLGKLGAPEDVASLCAFLASDLAGHITGQVIAVDGGQYI